MTPPFSRGPFRAAICLAITAAGSAFVRAQDPFQDVIRNLRHPKPETRLDSLERLNEAAHAAAAEAVAPLVVDPDDRVQAAAIDAELTFFVTERVNPVQVMGIGSSRSRAQAVFDTGPLIRGAAPAPPMLVDKLIAAMRDENARVAFDAVHALGFIAEAPLAAAQATALAAELEHYDAVMRAATARVLGRLRVREGADKLVAATVDSSELVRQLALEALGQVREPRTLPQIRQFASQPRHPLRPAAILALGQFGSADDASLFRQGLTDRSDVIRRGGVEGLGRLGDRTAVASLQPIAKQDRAASVRLAAAFALHKLGEPQAQLIAARLGVDTEAAQARDYLFELGRDALTGVIAALSGATDSRHRAALIQTVGYLGTAEDAAGLEPYLKDRDSRIVRAATHAITRLRR